MIDHEERIKRLNIDKARLWAKATGANEHNIRGLICCIGDTIRILRSDRSDEQKDYFFRNCALCISDMNLQLGGLTRAEAREKMAPRFAENRARRKDIGL